MLCLGFSLPRAARAREVHWRPPLTLPAEACYSSTCSCVSICVSSVSIVSVPTGLIKDTLSAPLGLNDVANLHSWANALQCRRLSPGQSSWLSRC